MGSSYSYTAPKLALAAVVTATFLAFCYVKYTRQQAPEKPSISRPEGSKKNKRKQAQNEEDPDEFLFPPAPLAPSTQRVTAASLTVVPGGFAEGVEPDAAAASKSKKSKKRKGKKAGADASTTPTPADDQSESSSAAAEHSKQHSSKKRRSANAQQDELWTWVEPRHRQKPHPTLETGEGRSTAELTSDAGVTTSVTENSSPVTERTEDETDPAPAQENRRTLSDKLLPKPRKTGVEDMLETPDYPSVARVMRIQPRPDEKPAPGFTWADYEDVHVAAEDADGEDDGGWGVVKPRGRSRPERSQQEESQRPQQSAPERKKQRQNAARREAQKAAKMEAETERLAILARHKKEQEKARIAEQYAQKPGKKAASGGASASVDDRGHLVWD